MAKIEETSTPHFPPGIRLKLDETRRAWLLLAPERVLMLDEVAVEVLRLVDGKTSVGAIGDDLAVKFSAAREEVVGDVVEMLQDLHDRGLIAV